MGGVFLGDKSVLGQVGGKGDVGPEDSAPPGPEGLVNGVLVGKASGKGLDCLGGTTASWSGQPTVGGTVRTGGEPGNDGGFVAEDGRLTLEGQEKEGSAVGQRKRDVTGGLAPFAGRRVTHTQPGVHIILGLLRGKTEVLRDFGFQLFPGASRKRHAVGQVHSPPTRRVQSVAEARDVDSGFVRHGFRKVPS